MNNMQLHNHNDVLEALVDEIEIPEHLHEKACDRYGTIGRWLSREESTIKVFRPSITPQGSFALGTAVKPLNEKDAYDVDLVATLSLNKDHVSMKMLKKMVGKEIKSYAERNNMTHIPEDKRRCWTMEYSDDVNFHIDVLPSIPDIVSYKRILGNFPNNTVLRDSNITNHAIAITDKVLPQYHEISDEWPISNPKGYANWFNRQQEIVREKRRRMLFGDAKSGSIEDIPAYRMKTPLQRAIQLFKRHRDSMFGGDEDKPISIIITTLAAHAYNGEEELMEAIRSILRGMEDFIEQTEDGIYWIPNPVNPEENFADKWSENYQKMENFFKWLEAAKKDFGRYLLNPYNKIPEDLKNKIGDKVVGSVANRLGNKEMPPTRSRIANEVSARQNSGPTRPWCRK